MSGSAASGASNPSASGDKQSRSASAGGQSQADHGGAGRGRFRLGGRLERQVEREETVKERRGTKKAESRALRFFFVLAYWLLWCAHETGCPDRGGNVARRRSALAPAARAPGAHLPRSIRAFQGRFERAGAGACAR